MRAERKIVQKHFFLVKRHDNKILRVQILLSRDFVVIAQAPCFLEQKKNQGKLPKKQGFFFPGELLKSFWKEGENARKARKSLQRKKIQKSKERKITERTPRY